MKILAPISLGELIDKITILELKLEYIKDPDKRRNIELELNELDYILKEIVLIPSISNERETLKAVNRELWHIEDFKRACEKTQTFDSKFIEAARNVYLKNDLRAEIKRSINAATGSTIVEEKSYS